MGTRREALQAGIGGALLGVARGAGETFSRALPPTTPYPEADFTLAQQACAPTPMIPKMGHASAIAKVFGDIVLRAQVRARLFAQYKNDPQIDPDLLVLKSLSPMAKLTITRQRRVEREMESIFSWNREDGPQPYSSVRSMVEQQIHMLMWGKS